MNTNDAGITTINHLQKQLGIQTVTRPIYYSCLIVFLIGISSSMLRADVRLPSVLAEHMVIQRNLPVHLWGSADPGEGIHAKFRDHEGSAVADNLGRWSIYLPSGEAGGPLTLTVRGKNAITFTDVMVGDVWIASGQSNMAFPMKSKVPWYGAIPNQENELAAANYPSLRLLRIQQESSYYPKQDMTSTGWTACNPESVGDFSAVAYFFGREIIEKQKVPIGLIEATWAGTPAEAWTSLDALSSDASLMPVFAAWSKMTDDPSVSSLQEKAESQSRERISTNAKQPTPPVWHLDPRSFAPSALFNAMIAPLTPFPIRGVIWYQGESNATADRAPIYARLFQTLIRDWRRHWAQGPFPFLYVQIANYDANNGWAEVRQAQLQALTLRHTGMAVTIDIGDPNGVHPKNKQEVGHRLALWARAISYHENIEDSGPIFISAVASDGQMQVRFTHTSGGLVVRGDKLLGFELAGLDGVFHSASASIDGNTVRVASSAVQTPVYVRYGWAANPQCNLYNGANLPASPFTSQDEMP